jgi:hypothetical protein
MGDERQPRLKSLLVRIEAGEVEDDEMDRLTRQLRSELREDTDADQVDLVRSGRAPEGTKAGEILQLGDLAVKILPAAVPGLIAVLRSWAVRHKQHDMKVMVKVGERAVELEYPVGTMTREDVLNLVAIVAAAPVDEPHPG